MASAYTHFDTHTVKRGTKLRVVQEVLGYTSLKTTSLYMQLAREDWTVSCRSSDCSGPGPRVVIG